jgi:dynein heavy chain, axonemal
VPDINFKEVRPFLGLEHFTPEAIRAKNSAAAGLCSWAINIVGYYDIVVTVAPKKEKLRAASEELEGANARLAAVRAQVATLQAQLDELGVKLAAAEAEKAAAVAEVDHGRGKLELATRLTAALADENVRWAAAIADMAASKDAVVGDTLLAAAFISYIGPFTKRYRDELVARHWVPFLETAVPGGGRLPMSPAPNPLAVLADDATIAGWKAQGLPDDTVSVENGAICTQTERWPLLIDPQLQGIAWLREREREAGLLVLRTD